MFYPYLSNYLCYLNNGLIKMFHRNISIIHKIQRTNAKITAAPTGTAVISYSQKKINNIDLSDTLVV